MAKKTITIIWCAGFTMHASARGLIALMRRRTLAPRITPRRDFPISSISTTASAEYDGDAQPAARSRGRGRHRDLSDDAEKAGTVVVSGCPVHGQSRAQ